MDDAWLKGMVTRKKKKKTIVRKTQLKGELKTEGISSLLNDVADKCEK